MTAKKWTDAEYERAQAIALAIGVTGADFRHGAPWGVLLFEFAALAITGILVHRFVRRLFQRLRPEREQFPAAERFRATKASLRGALREGER